MMRIRCSWAIGMAWIGVGIVCSVPATAVGQIIASDNAGNAAYADGWTSGDNGGTGFEPWFLDDTGGLDTYEIDTAPAEPDNDLGTPAFRLGTGGGFSTFFASRDFTVPMQAGQSFQIDYDAYSIDDFNALFGSSGRGDIGIFFDSASGSRLALYAYYAYDFGSDFWGINADSAFDNLNGGTPLAEDPLSGIQWQSTATVTDSEDGITLILDLPTIDTYRLRIIDDSVTKLDVSGTLNSESDGNPTVGEGISSVAFYGSDNEATAFPEDPDFFRNVAHFNNMQISGAAAPGVDGDYNDDGIVDAADYVIWRKYAGTSTELPNDPNSLPIGGAQYNTWRNNFGETSGGGSDSSSIGVPEPSTAVLLLLGCAAVSRIRRSL